MEKVKHNESLNSATCAIHNVVSTRSQAFERVTIVLLSLRLATVLRLVITLAWGWWRGVPWTSVMAAVCGGGSGLLVATSGSEWQRGSAARGSRQNQGITSASCRAFRNQMLRLTQAPRQTYKTAGVTTVLEPPCVMTAVRALTTTTNLMHRLLFGAAPACQVPFSPSWRGATRGSAQTF